MDDDWLESEDVVDERATDFRLQQNEREHISQRETNQGYLDGLEWADTNFASFDCKNVGATTGGIDSGAQQSLYYSSVMELGIEEGIALAEGCRQRMELTAKLLVKSLTCETEAESTQIMELIGVLNDAEDDKSIPAQALAKINQLIQLDQDNGATTTGTTTE